MIKVTIKLKGINGYIISYIDTIEDLKKLETKYYDKYESIALGENVIETKPKTKTLTNKWKGNWC